MMIGTVYATHDFPGIYCSGIIGKDVAREGYLHFMSWLKPNTAWLPFINKCVGPNLLKTDSQIAKNY